VVGGGSVATRKARSLAAAGACVSVIAPRLSAAMAVLVKKNGFTGYVPRIRVNTSRVPFL